MSQTVKNLPVMRETWVQFLGRKEPLEKGMAIHSSTLAWRILCSLVGYSPWGLQRAGHHWATNTFTLSLHSTKNCSGNDHRLPQGYTKFQFSVLIHLIYQKIWNINTFERAGPLNSSPSTLLALHVLFCSFTCFILHWFLHYAILSALEHIWYITGTQ